MTALDIPGLFQRGTDFKDLGAKRERQKDIKKFSFT